MIMASLYLPPSCWQSLQTPCLLWGNFIASQNAAAQPWHPPPPSSTSQSSYSAPWRAAAGTWLSSVRWLMNGMNCIEEMWKNRERVDGGEKLTLHDRGLAVAEQGQMSLGYMFMHGTALRDASELTAGMGLARRNC